MQFLQPAQHHRKAGAADGRRCAAGGGNGFADPWAGLQRTLRLRFSAAVLPRSSGITWFRFWKPLRRIFATGKFRGIRISTRPDAIDPEILSILKHYGVTTIELGAQSMDDRVLLHQRARPHCRTGADRHRN